MPAQKQAQTQEKKQAQTLATASVQELMDGVSLVFHTLHTAESGQGTKPPPPHTLEIHHCRAGRFCCTFADGTKRTLVPGEIAVDLLAHKPASIHFPDAKYSGVSLVVDIPTAQPALNEMLHTVTGATLNLAALEAAAEGAGGFVLPNVERNDALFSALYLAAGHREDVALLRLRVLEILAHSCYAADAWQQNGCWQYQDRQMLAVRDYLAAHCGQHITLQQLAERFGLSQTALRQRFTHAFGTTIGRYIRRYRLKTAAHLLLTTNRTIADIAPEVGFQSASVFSVRFAEHFGLPPGQYRQAAQKKCKIGQNEQKTGSSRIE